MKKALHASSTIMERRKERQTDRKKERKRLPLRKQNNPHSLYVHGLRSLICRGVKNSFVLRFCCLYRLQPHDLYGKRRCISQNKNKNKTNKKQPRKYSAKKPNEPAETVTTAAAQTTARIVISSIAWFERNALRIIKHNRMTQWREMCLKFLRINCSSRFDTLSRRMKTQRKKKHHLWSRVGHSDFTEALPRDGSINKPCYQTRSGMVGFIFGNVLGYSLYVSNTLDLHA